MLLDRRTAVYINQRFRVEDLLWEYFRIRPGVNGTFRCPFHDDNKRSAQLFSDNRFFCYAVCGQQFTPTKILLRVGVKVDSLIRMVPSNFVETDKVGYVFNFPMYKKISESLAKVFKTTNRIELVMDNWLNVLKNMEEEQDDLRE
jgi:hypothetical protein